MRHLARCLLLLLVTSTSLVRTQVPYNPSPSWISADANKSTGGAWVDINADGWLDLVVANGNDIARQHVAVYYNTGSGVLPLSPDWQSGDVDYHGHLAVGDVDNDGLSDVAVSVYLGAAGFGRPGRVKLYMNRAGTLESIPSWVSSDSMSTFSCAFGDPDADGDLDLAVACGEIYDRKAEQNRVYFNNGGRLDTLPGWKSNHAGYSLDVVWADVENDGRLDLLFANGRGANVLYRNYGDSLGSDPVWSSADTSQSANSLFVADINGDGFQDVAVSENSQLGGRGRFTLYRNNGGTLGDTPFWTSAFQGYGSGITLVDVDNDGDRDLVTGGWWQPCRIYLNQAGEFAADPQWVSATSTVVEAIVAGDVDNGELVSANVALPSDGSTHLFALPEAPLHRIESVRIGPTIVDKKQYCADLEGGWVSLALAPSAGDTVFIEAVASHQLDLAVTNWDGHNLLFLNTSTVGVPEGGHAVPVGFRLFQNSPNPFNPSTQIRFQIGEPGFVSLRVYDVLGRLVRTLLDARTSSGTHTVLFDASQLSSGTYLYRLEVRPGSGVPSGAHVETRKMVLRK